MKIWRAMLPACISLSLAGCQSIYYVGPQRNGPDVAQVYLQSRGALTLGMYKINGEEHPFEFMNHEAYIPPGKYALEYNSEDYKSVSLNEYTVGCGNTVYFETEWGVAGFVTFNVGLKPGYSYFVVAYCTDSDTLPSVCIFEELQNDPAPHKPWLSPREPQDKTKPLQCKSLEWKAWTI